MSRTWLKPSLVDLFFVVLMVAAFGRPQSWQGLLADGDTGWHIRTGDYILQTGTVPFHDLYSFSNPGQPWFAWEWLADVVFSLLNRWHGLAAVAACSAAVLCFAATLLLSWLLHRGTGLWVAVAVVLATVSESSVHALARPHIFSLLLLTVGLWALDRDRRRPRYSIWLQIPLSAVWANLHAGFVSWLAILGLLVVVEACQRDWPALRRYSLLAALCTAATFVNPYGWHLHQHIARYLGSSWIMAHVQEFQSPNIRSENMLVFAILLLLGVALASRAFARHDWFGGALVLVWAFASMRSARHIPIYGVAAAPLIASECAGWWSQAAASRSSRSAVRVFWDLSRELGRSCQISVWTPILGLFGILVALPLMRSADFPSARFPVAGVTANVERLAGAGRILTSDQWGDYLIYRFYPRQRVFFDGRSDFYGPAIGEEYQNLLGLRPGWQQTLERYRFDAALLPRDWPLADVLAGNPDWNVVYRDPVCTLLVHRSPASLRSQSKGNHENCRMYSCGPGV
jgi:hypothetical protein